MNERAIFAAALDLTDPADRAAYLDRACAGHPELRRHVEGLLAAQSGLGSFLDHPAGGDGTVVRPPAEGPGSRVGPYKLLQEIGEGGMGTVFMAEQEEPVRRMVAVKIIRAGMDSKGVLARFEAERQALALMDHPNIARVLDAGTTAGGSPYFVMELVKGVPITRFCDDHQLSLRERLELFVPVCQAIQHAHMKGVIHRDVKPSNVLVAMYDDQPVPKVIDFGVAKAAGQKLTDKTLFTAFGAVVGTLEYMSPEQAKLNQLDVDTRSDVYALGVLLYELLTGSTPLDRGRLRSAALDEVLRLIREEEPPKPSTRLSTAATLPQIAAARKSPADKLGNLLRGELDWIVMKALEKDRTRRYETANGFAADVQRYLSGEPVQAVPPSLGYRMTKAYRRNKAAILGGGLIALVLLLGIIGTTAGLVWAVGAEQQAKADRDAAVTAQGEANSERDRANAEAEKATAARERQLADQYLADMQLVPIPFQAGSASEVNKLLARHVPTPGEPDRRGFEWHYWNRQQNPQVLTDRLADCEDSRNGAWAASADGGRIARLVSRTRAEERPVLTVWDRATRRVVLSYTLPIPAAAVGSGFGALAATAPQLSPDGRRVAVEWTYRKPGDVAPGGGPGGELRPAFAPFGSGPVFFRQVIDVDTGKPLIEPPGSSHFTSIRDQFSSDGKRFASLCAVAATPGDFQAERVYSFQVWDLETRQRISPEEAPTPFSWVRLHPDGRTCVRAGQHTAPDPAVAALAGGPALHPTTLLSRCDVRTGEAEWARRVPCGYLEDLTVSPDGTLIAGTQLDRRQGLPACVTVWDAATGHEVSSWPVPDPASRPRVLELVFSPGGARLVVAMTTWDRWRGTPTVNVTGPGSAPNRLVVLDPRTGTAFPPIDGLTGLQMDSLRVQLIQLVFSADGKQVYTPGDSTIRTWDVRTGLPHRAFRGPVDPPVACGFTADGTRLWSVERDGAYKEWDLRPTRPVTVDFQGGDARLTPEFAVSGDGGRFAQLARTRNLGDGAAEFAVQMRDVDGNSGKLLTPPPRAVGPTRFPYDSRCGLALSHDGGRVLLARGEFSRGGGVGVDPNQGLPPHDLTVWDTGTGERLFHQSVDGQLMQVIPGPFGGDGYLVVLSPDGRSVAAGITPAADGDPMRVRVFDVDSGRERPPLTLAGATTLAALAFSPDGKRVAAMADYKDTTRRSARLVVWGADGGEPAVVAVYRDAKVVGGFQGIRAGVVWTPDGSRLVASCDTRADAGFAIHDAATGTAVALELPVSRFTVFPTGVVCSPDGRRVAAFLDTARTGQPEVKVWDAASGKVVVTLRKQLTTERTGGSAVLTKDRQLAFTPDGHRLIGWEFGGVPEWSPETGTVMVPAYSRTVWDASPPPEQKK